jgi:hypothetical protein
MLEVCVAVGELPIGIPPEEVEDFRTAGEVFEQDGDDRTFGDEVEAKRFHDEMIAACMKFMRSRGLVK